MVGDIHDRLFDQIDDLAALVHHCIACRIDRIDEVAVDEHARQNPGAQQQDDISQHADHARQPPGDLDPEGTAPPAAENGPLLAEGEAQRKGTQNQNQQSSEHRMVEKQRTLADDPHSDHRDDQGQNDTEQAERPPHQKPGQPSPGVTAGILDRIRQVCQAGILLFDTGHKAHVGPPVEIVKQHRSRQEKPREKQQQAQYPTHAVTVGTGGSLRAFCRTVFLGSHIVYLSSEGRDFFRKVQMQDRFRKGRPPPIPFSDRSRCGAANRKPCIPAATGTLHPQR